MKRGHDSPDRADAAVLAMWDEVEVRSNIAVRGGNIVRPGVK
jgi:hypothetical protein